VPQGRAGLIVLGGLTPLSAVEEAGIHTHNRALTGLFEFSHLLPYQHLPLVAGLPQARDSAACAK